jgi:hypothetical protein
MSFENLAFGFSHSHVRAAFAEQAATQLDFLKRLAIMGLSHIMGPASFWKVVSTSWPE